jgi:hypothetical protein
VQLAVLNSPKLQAVQTQLQQARAKLIQAGLLPDPQFSTSFDFPTSNDPLLMNGYNFGLGFDLQSLITRSDPRSRRGMTPGVCWTYEKSTRQLFLRCSTSCIHAVVCGRDNGPKYPDLSLNSYHYAPQNHTVFDFIRAIARHRRLLLLATITLSPTDS